MSGFAGFRQVGEFGQQRPIIRAVPNPRDVSTIVCIYPKDWSDRKETLQPNEFHVKGGTFEEPGLTTIKTATYTQDNDPDKPLQEILLSSIQVSESIIRDYCIGLLGVSIGTAQPGMFFVPGEIKKIDEIKKNYFNDLLAAKLRQDKWFQSLIKIADALWSRSDGNPMMIWDEMRFAAEQLGVEREWVRQYSYIEKVRCFACGAQRDPRYPICPSCKTIDMSHEKAKDIVTAKA